MREASHPLHRADDRELVRSSLRAMGSKPFVDILFGGLVDNTGLVINVQFGANTRILMGHRVRAGEGLGGKSMQQARPVGVSDYFEAQDITHIFDDIVRTEGLCTLVAIPVLVEDRARGVLYAGTRNRFDLGSAVLREFQQSASLISYELRVRDEVDRRISILRIAENEGLSRDREVLDTLRENLAELISIARLTDNPELTASLTTIAARLGEAGAGEPAPDAPRLSKRQLDVLHQVALGCEYAEVARRLGLQLVTVRSYMRAIMAKLDASNRVEAVAVARRHGLLL